ncbi:MAG: ABC transporter substrate-binding protein [Gemmatimonadetes bacterium]|nr:ABC transporter substrate-binding protein [Gemmatimonadota bacterium]
MPRRLSLFSVLTSLNLAGVASCRPAERAPGHAVIDDLGRRVAVSGPPRRIVSLAPSTTELLFALGAGPRLVGRTRWCDYPREVSAIPSVGDGLNPNLEAVAGRSPDLVVMYATSANAPAVAQLGRLGIPAVNVRMDRLSDLSHAARLLGRLLGDSARADSLAAGFEEKVAALRAARDTTGPRVVMVVWDNPPMVIGAGSFLTDLIELAGARNAFADIVQPSATVSIETIAARNPDLLLVHATDTAGPAFARRPEWLVVRVVRERRFAYVHGSEFERPSFRAPDAVRHLRDILAEARR